MVCTTNKLPRMAEGPAALYRGGGGAGRRAAAAAGGGRRRARNPDTSAMAAAAPSEAIAGVLSPLSASPAAGQAPRASALVTPAAPGLPIPPLRAWAAGGIFSDHPPQTAPLRFCPLQWHTAAAAGRRAACNLLKAPPRCTPRRVPHARPRRPPPRGGIAPAPQQPLMTAHRALRARCRRLMDGGVPHAAGAAAVAAVTAAAAEAHGGASSRPWPPPATGQSGATVRESHFFIPPRPNPPPRRVRPPGVNYGHPPEAAPLRHLPLQGHRAAAAGRKAARNTPEEPSHWHARLRARRPAPPPNTGPEHRARPPIASSCRSSSDASALLSALGRGRAPGAAGPA